jgi:hypothetical protein
MTRIKRIPFHPFLLGLYPVFALIAHNVSQINLSDTLRALGASIIGLLVWWLILRLIVRDIRKAALACTLSALLFFSYGHVYAYLERLSIFGAQIGRHRYLLPIWLGSFVLVIWWVAVKLRDVTTLTTTLNVASVIAVVFPLVQIGSYEVRLMAVQSEIVARSSSVCETSLTAGEAPPDVYYIILDAYTREDVFDEIYDYDNSEFLEIMRGLGFYIAPLSQSNYGFTGLSLASSLNLDYLENLDERLVEGNSHDLTPLWPLLTKSVVRESLECLGYKVVTFDSGYYWSGWPDADLYFNFESSIVNKMENTGGINAFESLLINSSAVLVLTDAAEILPNFIQSDLESPRREHWNRIVYLLDCLERKVPMIEGPKFVFAHVLIPHTPFVFGPNGEYKPHSGAFTLDGSQREMTFEERTEGYTDQVRYVNTRIEKAVRAILEESDRPPVIIIQGDHGLDGPIASQMAIINAYYLPENGKDLLYETITPVNSFRIVFDRYFGGNYGMLEDKSLYSRHAAPFKFTHVPTPQANR